MTFKVSGKVEVDGKAAKAEIDALAGSLRSLGPEADAVSTKGRKAAQTTTAVGQAAAKADAQVTALKSEMAGLKTTIDALTAAETRAAAGSTAMASKLAQLEARLGRGGRGGGGSGAAGAAGNLVSQFNDIGVMLMAGQNPLQLAIQQGTQITQVIGPMGAGGAVKALGGAFLGMLNPLNLVVLGSIAAGAAMIQWLTGASEDAKTVEDAVQDLQSAVVDFKAVNDIYSTEGVEALIEKYGELNASVLLLIQRQAEVGRGQVGQAATTAVSAFEDELDGGFFSNLIRSDVDEIAAAAGIGQTIGATIRLGVLGETDQIMVDYRSLLAQIEASRAAGDTEGMWAGQEQLDNLLNTLNPKVEQLRAALQQANDARGTQEQIAAMQNLSNVIQGTALETSDMADNLNNAWDALLQLQAATQNQSGFAAAALREQVSAQQELDQSAARGQVDRAAARREDSAALQSMIADLTAQADLNAVIAAYGADSAQATQAQAAAARAVAVEMINASEASAELKAQAIAAYDAANAIAATNVAAPLSAGADQAGRIADNLLAALSFAQQIAMVQAATPTAPPPLGFGLGDAPDGGTGVTLGFGTNRGSNFNSPPPKLWWRWTGRRPRKWRGRIGPRRARRCW